MSRLGWLPTSLPTPLPTCTDGREAGRHGCNDPARRPSGVGGNMYEMIIGGRIHAKHPKT